MTECRDPEVDHGRGEMQVQPRNLHSIQTKIEASPQKTIILRELHRMSCQKKLKKIEYDTIYQVYVQGGGEPLKNKNT